MKSKQMKDKAKGEPCALCGRPEPYPVEMGVPGHIRWICYQCWKQRKGPYGKIDRPSKGKKRWN